MTIPSLWREVFRDCGIAYLALVHTIIHGKEVYNTIKEWTGFAQDIERRIGDRRKHMNVLEIPQFVKDVVQLANDVKSAESVIAPQFPQLVADAEKIKTDGEKLLGINDIAAPIAPPTPPAAS